MDGRAEQVEKIPRPPLHILFLFLYLKKMLLLFFAMFCVDMGHFLKINLTVFLYFLCLQFLGFPM